ncbi:MAG: methylisocitrate lyase [Legionellales bacterium]|nr:methylisocitrate lyase [Legionellales bacterium]|tara:strand:- start:1361 stop:2215 length:855 start_codon:yes stop_codon:yes gene_type:complete
MENSINNLLENEKLLTLVGVPNPLIALMAEKKGFKCLYVSGACVANHELGIPDLAMTSLDNVCYVVRNMRAVTNLPILVDADTGWGGLLNVKRTVKQLVASGASGLHIEDQSFEKKCGHLDGKTLIPLSDMSHKISVAKETAPEGFMVMARTDALAVEGLEKTIERSKAYEKAGAGALFLEAAKSTNEFQSVCSRVSIPVLANMTEFGKTPPLTDDELINSGVKMKLYPLSLFRLMNKAAEDGLSELSDRKSFNAVLEKMQSRKDLYDLIEYDEYAKVISKEVL